MSFIGNMSRRQALAMLASTPLIGQAGLARAQNASVEQLLAAAKKEGKVVVYSIFPQTVEAAMMAMYQQDTGITMEYSRIGGTNPTLQKFYTQEKVGQHLTDVIVLEKSASIIMANDRLAAAYAPPVKSSILPAFQSKDDFAHTAIASFQVVVYNKDLVKQDQLPREWKDLAKPEFKNKIVVGSPENSGSVLVLIKTLVDMYGWDFIQALISNGLIETTREVEGADLVARGERTVAVIAQTAPAAQIKAGAPIGFHFPDRPVAVEFSASVPANTPHPNAARHFLNYMLSEKYQTRVVTDLGGYSVLPQVAPPAGLPPLASLKVEPFDYAAMLDVRDTILERWRTMMSKK
ncbi:ABC transporter substrate-binding protein [Bosea sp. (in: a-proteobacteria)]|uniref:ABC transporter substrate-binding protein n=1 Tax=Bosea sp. (in: a-proteobacteria) TaxID=1871050 RepID=UPI00261DEFDE|nr:extracellular solute-binding protein [Bosea sp. (in: a-proteobacteria)]MCO5091267.1 extracellular solute-binding protein [Bosea sp. (in: a-proteobacteria)]